LLAFSRRAIAPTHFRLHRSFHGTLKQRSEDDDGSSHVGHGDQTPSETNHRPTNQIPTNQIPTNYALNSHHQPWLYSNGGKITALELDLNTTKINLANLDKKVDRDMTTIGTAVRNNHANLTSQISEVKSSINTVKDKLTREINTVKDNFTREITGVKDTMKDGMHSLTKHMGIEFRQAEKDRHADFERFQMRMLYAAIALLLASKGYKSLEDFVSPKPVRQPQPTPQAMAPEPAAQPQRTTKSVQPQP